jgi:hypothetical protein
MQPSGTDGARHHDSHSVSAPRTPRRAARHAERDPSGVARLPSGSSGFRLAFLQETPPAKRLTRKRRLEELEGYAPVVQLRTPRRPAHLARMDEFDEEGLLVERPRPFKRSREDEAVLILTGGQEAASDDEQGEEGKGAAFMRFISSLAPQ